MPFGLQLLPNIAAEQDLKLNVTFFMTRQRIVYNNKNKNNVEK